MKIFELCPQVSGMRSLVIDDNTNTWTEWRKFSDPVSLNMNWLAPETRFAKPDEFDDIDNDSNISTETDCPWLRGTLIKLLSRRAVAVFNHFISNKYELLPVNCGDRDFYALHCITPQNNLIDLSKCEGSRSSRDGRILTIRRYAFHASVLQKSDIIFSVSQPDPYKIYVTDEFVKLSSEAHLMGFDFREIWSA